jgi:hypothetical protein
MVPHDYLNASDNIAQYHADQIGRQEVTVDWYLDNMIDACVFRWTSDDDAAMGLDPWRFYMDLPIEPEDVKERGWRLFVQRDQMPADLRTEAHKPFPALSFPLDERTDAELFDAADQRWKSQ